MTVADPSSAPALKAAAKKARLDRKQATQVAFAKAQDAAAMPPPPKPGIQAREGKDKKKTAGAASARIKKKKTPEAAVPSDNTDADERTGSDAGSAAPTRAGNTKVGNTPRTTAHCSPALSAHACTPQTTPNCKHKTQTTHHLSNSWTPLEFTDPEIKLELDQSSSKEKPRAWIPSPLNKQSPTHWRVGENCADTPPLVCPQNITIKVMIADELKRGLGYIFVVEQLVAPLLALVGATSTEAAMKHWLVTCNKPNMVGPFFVQCPDFLLEEISTIQKFRARPSAKFSADGKVVQLEETEPTIRFKVSKASAEEMRQVRPTASKPGGSWLTIKVSAEASADQGACKHGLGIALNHAGFTLKKIAFQRKSTFKVAVNCLHCDVQSVPTNGTFDFTAPLDFHIKTDGIFKPHTALFERLAPELFIKCELKPCKHHIHYNCLCNVKSTRKPWTKPPPKDSASAERELLAKARAQQEAEDSACKLPLAYIPIYSYRWDHTLGYEGEGPPPAPSIH